MSNFIKDIENALLNGDISLKEIMRAHLDRLLINSFKRNLLPF